jgi:hypothetical protein
LDFWIYPCKGEKGKRREVEITKISKVGRILVWLVGRFPLNTLTKVSIVYAMAMPEIPGSTLFS